VVATLAALGAAAYFFVLAPKGDEEVETTPTPDTNAVAQTNLATNTSTNLAGTNAPAIKPLPVIQRPQITSPFLNLSDLKEAPTTGAAGATPRVSPPRRGSSSPACSR